MAAHGGSGAGRKVKVLLLGESAVGKTSLAKRFVEGECDPNMASTIGVDLSLKRFVVDGTKVTLSVWDTAGQERFRSIPTSFYRETQGILLVYDCTNELSFTLLRKWMHTVNEINANVPRMLLCNKIDLVHLRSVSEDAGRALAQELHCRFFAVSAIDGTNVELAFTELTREILTLKEFEKNTIDLDRIGAASVLDQKGGKCC